MRRKSTRRARFKGFAACGAALIGAAMVSATGQFADAIPLGPNPDQSCAALAGAVSADAIGVKSGPAVIDSAVIAPATTFAVAERGPSPSARITPATPSFCKLLGHIDPIHPNTPRINFEINLPLEWNGRAAQYGGGGFNGVLITGLALPPAFPFDRPSPLAQGFVTYGTDSGHQTKPGEEAPAFAANDEAFENFAHLAYKKVRDVAVATVKRAYGKAPDKLYFLGSSEGGREGLTMAQRYPADFDGVFSRVPVINWVGLQHAGWASGRALMGKGYLTSAHVKLVHDAVLAACDRADGVADGIISNPVACKSAFDITKLACSGGQSGDACLSPEQVKAVQTLHAPFRFSEPLANGLDDYPGWGVSGEATQGFASTGGWPSWWSGSTPPAQPPQPTNGIAWIYGSGGMRHVILRDPNADATVYDPTKHMERIRQVSALMDSTNPDLSAFAARGGKLIMLEHMADYAQSPYAGIRYFESVQKKLGAERVRGFARLFTAPGVDHVGSGAPANVDMLSALVDWVEKDKAPAGLELIEQSVEATPKTSRARPLCEWPMWPQYRSGDVNDVKSFACVN
ncbi:tannase/feruloyl esterase family alpha/beta hydrolase [Terrarubrum flagellatum]|uniref:tannase/feruloyl esterase family alpha/beta hydrolase n=1 Tax=Terrirubrum flagellatum TaxID=2895980 RepID=UPI0031450BAC